MAEYYGARERRRLEQMEAALGRRPKERRGESSRESRTQDEIRREAGPPSDVLAPADQDMWDEETGTFVPVSTITDEAPVTSAVVPCEDLFPEVFETVELGFAIKPNEGPSKSSRIGRYKFVSDGVCTEDSTINDITGYLYVEWMNNLKVGRYGPMSYFQFNTFRTSSSLGSNVVAPGYKAPDRTIDLYALGYTDLGDSTFPGDEE